MSRHTVDASAHRTIPPDLETPSSRRRFLATLAAGSAGGLLASGSVSSLLAQTAGFAPGPAISVYKDPSCGCCTAWVEHMKKAGFVTTIHNTPDLTSVKASMGVPAALSSCHTAVIGKYVIEGHVPADLVTRLLAEKPVATGLAVPGMPAGSPGMETPDHAKDPYKVLLFDRSGKTSVFATR